MNILYSAIYLFITFLLTVFVYHFFKREGMYIWICLSIIISNIQSVKIIDVFGLSVVLGNIAYSNVFLATDILNEFEGKKVANKSVLFGFLSIIVFTLLMAFSLLFEPSDIDIAQKSLEQIFLVIPRLCLASLCAYLVSQYMDVYIYEKLKKKYNKLWLSNNLSTIVSQLVDTIVFIIVGYYGSANINDLITMGITMYILKIIIALLDTGFIYLSKSMKKEVI